MLRKLREMIAMSDIARLSIAFSYLGKLVLDGNVEAVKFLYGNIWGESPPLIRTIGELQGCLTSVEVEHDMDRLYSTEFLYYWAMICIGEQSPLIFKDLGTAEACFKIIWHAVPMVEARLAYIELLKTTDPAKAECNVARLDVLRRWANKHDLFSRIVLAKISFFSFLQEELNGADELPVRMMQLLELPCQLGHPVAIRFWNDMCSYLGNPRAMLDARLINADILYDFKPLQKCK